jgi:2-(1,2-epoxy-1,2-dihydrophenyl)acetyl-CoA isomerase
VLLRSVGKNFCAGADLAGSDGTGRGKPATGHMRQHLAAGAHGLILAVWHCRVPVIAAVQGRAAGLGCNLAAACDLVVAARSASFSEPFGHLGFSVDSGGSWLLPRRIGLTRAAVMLFRGTVVDATQAEEWGLVTEVVDDAALDKTAADLATELAAGPTLALSLTKGLLHRYAGTGGDLPKPWPRRPWRWS